MKCRRRHWHAGIDGISSLRAGANLALHTDMNLYRSLGAEVGTLEALDLAQRLAVWHDAMVLHNRRAGGTGGDLCENECPHVDARALWIEALDVFGRRAHELGFLRTHGAVALGSRGRLAARANV